MENIFLALMLLALPISLLCFGFIGIWIIKIRERIDYQVEVLEDLERELLYNRRN